MFRRKQVGKQQGGKKRGEFVHKEEEERGEAARWERKRGALHGWEMPRETDGVAVHVRGKRIGSGSRRKIRG